MWLEKGLGVVVGLTVADGVPVGVVVGVTVGAVLSVGVVLGLGVGVGVGPLCAQYLPPVFTSVPLDPPQMIISLPVQTAVWLYRPSGALVTLVGTQLSVPALYLPPVSNSSC